MLDHVSITVSDIQAAERFYDAIMKTLGVVKVGRRDDWLGYGERARPAYPDRVYLTIRKGERPEEAAGRHWCFKAKWRTQVERSGMLALPQAAPTTARRVCATITPPTMQPSSEIPTATGSKRFAIIRSSCSRRFHFPSGARLGSRIVTCVPLSGSLSRRRRPPRRFVTTLWTMWRPRPVHPKCRLVVKNGSNA
jgi:hypothetical protein